MEPVPDTPRRPVTTTYHGVDVTEDYRWLEETASDETRRWTDAQSARTRSHLEALPPRGPIGDRVRELIGAESVQYDRLAMGGPHYFALKAQPPLQQPFLVVLDRLDGTTEERVLVDPNSLDESGATAIDWFVPSPDGVLVAVSLSRHGTEDGTLYVYDVDTGKETDTVIEAVNSGTAGGSLAWRGDGRGFWYTRHPRPGERPDADLGFFQDVWFHDLDDHTDVRELSGCFADDRIAENFLSSSPDGRWVADMVQKGDGGEWELFLRAQDEGAEWQRLTDVSAKWIAARFAAGAVFVLSRMDAPRGQVLRVPLPDDRPVSVDDAEVFLQQDSLTIDVLAATRDRLWVAYLDGGPSALRVFDSTGARVADPEVPAVSAVASITALGEDAVAWAVESFVSPRSWWFQGDGDERPRRTALDSTSPVDFSGITVERVFASSKDGTKVPISLVRPTDLGDGPAPTVLYGYGGYSISLKPFFDPSLLVWLEQGGVHAIANVRGGGEYGEEWHHAGRLTTKQNCFDDFAACADHLVETGVTSRDRLAIMGGSNGGLLVGAVLTQRPDVAAAVVAAVPVMDSLRSELTPNGQFNVTEFGTVDDPDHFRALLAYSPYHNVRDGAAYPAVLLTAGESDPRVDAWHAKKMAARLQGATSSDAPVLLRMDAGGHGIGQSLDEQVSLWADIYTFLFDRLGLSDG